MPRKLGCSKAATCKIRVLSGVAKLAAQGLPRILRVFSRALGVSGLICCVAVFDGFWANSEGRGASWGLGMRSWE